jgi:nucleoside triphosphate pyrophosphatase
MPPSPRLVLASASPRRRSLLEQLGLRLQIDPPHVDETVRPGEPPDAYVLRMARDKAAAVQVRHPRATVLAADTSVVLEGAVLGKPGSAEEATAMLAALAGRTHHVLTAVAVAGVGERLVSAAVTFAPASEQALRWYVETGEPMDKAGAYAVQGIGGFLVKRIEGSVSAVVGLPLVETLALLEQAGYTLPWERR